MDGRKRRKRQETDEVEDVKVQFVHRSAVQQSPADHPRDSSRRLGRSIQKYQKRRSHDVQSLHNICPVSPTRSPPISPSGKKISFTRSIPSPLPKPPSKPPKSLPSTSAILKPTLPILNRSLPIRFKPTTTSKRNGTPAQLRP